MEQCRPEGKRVVVKRKQEGSVRGSQPERVDELNGILLPDKRVQLIDPGWNHNLPLHPNEYILVTIY